MAAQPSTGQADAVTTMHRYKLPPPHFNGEYSTYEEWRYKFLAYIGLQDPEFPELVQNAEDSNQQITNAFIDQVANSPEQATRWKRLAADLHFILINVCTGPAATTCRQNAINSNGLETWRQLRFRFSIPTGTRSVGYLTKLIKPTLDETKFEESFAQWEHDVQRYEQDNGTPLPDGVKIAIIEYYRSTSAFSRMQAITNTTSNQGPAPMDIGATHWGKAGKGNKGKGSKGKSKGAKGSKGHNSSSNKGYGKSSKGAIGQGNPFKGGKGYIQNNKGKGKAPPPPPYNKGKGKSKDICYKCGQPGHIARNCRLQIYNLEDPTGQATHDPYYEWYNDQQNYDQSWQHDWSQGPQQQYVSQPQQLALPPPQTQFATSSNGPVIQAINNLEHLLIATLDSINNIHEDNVDLMIDSGAAAHVCPAWFGKEFPLNHIPEQQKPTLMSVTNNKIQVYGYRWIHFNNEHGQSIVIPFYVCQVKQPILSVSRLAHQGFDINFNSETPSIKHERSFHSTLKQRNGLFYITLRKANMPEGMQLKIETIGDQQIAMVAPTTMTPTGPQVMRGGNTDMWAMNNEGYLVRIHKRLRRALFTPFNSDCPIPLDQLEDYRKTIIRQPKQEQRVITDSFQSISRQQQNRIVDGQAWIGETWFKPKATAKPITSTMPAITPTDINRQQRSTTTSSKSTSDTTPSQSAEAQTQARQQPYTRHTGKQPTKGSAVPTPDMVDKTRDYWIKEGRFWKRVHVKPRTTYYVPTQADGGPDVNNLLPTRTTIIHPTDGTRPRRVDDQWTTDPQPEEATLWTGSTNLEEKAEYKDQFESDDEEHQPAVKAKAATTPYTPTPQEVQEHNLTHLPYRNWCPICVQGRGRATNHPTQKSKQPVIQVDFAYIKAHEDKEATPVLTAIDVQTGLCMAAMIPDKQQLFDYATNCLQTFLIESGRTEAILQSDQEDYLIQLLRATANSMGNVSVRFSPAYSSQSQGAVERLHRTLFGQFRVLREHVRQHYKKAITTRSPIMAWMMRHCAYLTNNYLQHSDGQTSYFRRWQRNNTAPLCEFGETVLYMIPTTKGQPKAEPRFFNGIWLGRDNTTGESYIGITGRVVRARTIRRQVEPHKYNNELLDTINGTPWAPKPPTYMPTFLQPAITINKPETSTTQEETTTTTHKDPRHDGSEASKRQRTAPTTIEDEAMTTTAAPHSLAAAAGGAAATGSQTRRSRDDAISQGSEAKQQRTSQQQTAIRREEPDPTQPTSKMRINAITVTLKNGKQVKTATSEDQQEVRNEQRLLEPMIFDTQGFEPEQLRQGMMKEMQSMVQQDVFEETHISNTTPHERANIVDSRWVHRDKIDEVRCRIVAKGFNEAVKDEDDIYASTPLFAVLRTILAITIAKGWSLKIGDISTAFLHAAIQGNILMRPPKEFYTDPNILWRLKKAMYGLRSSPKAWQDHLATVLQQLGYIRLTSEPNVFRHPDNKAYIMVYVDDLLFTGETQEINRIFKEIQQHLLLRQTGESTPGSTVSFLGRKIINRGNHFEITLGKDYITDILKEAKLENCNPATTPGATATRDSIEDEQLLNVEQHKHYRRMVGKLQWLSYTRPDIAYATKELARGL
eukprot:s1005_g4.t4